MKVCGIVAEWHPFHQGHARFIQEIRSIEPDMAIISVMSGPFTQRGEAALFDKWTRAATAVAGGIDLVLELHQGWATASLEHFAEGGLATLLATGLVTHLAFGSECGELDRLQHLAHLQRKDPPCLQKERRERLDKGIPFAAAQQEALEMVSGETHLAERPNDRLAMHYLNHWPTHQSVFAIQRNTYHHGHGSGSAIRQSLRQGESIAQLLPQSSLSYLRNALVQGWLFPNPEKLYPTLQALLLRESPAGLEEKWHLQGGASARYLKAISAPTLEDFRKEVQSRHLTFARIDRDLLTLLAPVQKPFQVPYLRVLSANTTGRKLLRALPNSAPPLLINLGKDAKKLNAESQAALKDDILRQNVSSLYQEAPSFTRFHRDYLEPPRIIHP